MNRTDEDFSWTDGVRTLATAVSALGIVSYITPPQAAGHQWKICIPLGVLALSVFTSRHKVAIVAAAGLFLLMRAAVALVWYLLGVLPR